MEHDHLTIKDWLITLLILSIPTVNLIMLFVWGFGTDVNPSKKTFCQASLLYTVIVTVLSIILMALFGAAFASALEGLY